MPEPCLCKQHAKAILASSSWGGSFLLIQEYTDRFLGPRCESFPSLVPLETEVHAGHSGQCWPFLSSGLALQARARAVGAGVLPEVEMPCDSAAAYACVSHQPQK